MCINVSLIKTISRHFFLRTYDVCNSRNIISAVMYNGNIISTVIFIKLKLLYKL
jgi:hypothetical protein